MKHLISNIAQILLIILVFPFIGWFLDTESLLNFLDSIPIFNTWIQLLYNAHTIDTSNLFLIYFTSFFEAIVLGICTHVCVQIHTLSGNYGLPIFPTFLGVAIACGLFSLLSVAGAFQLLLYLVIIGFGLWLMLKSLFKTKRLFSTENILLLVVESLFAVVICGYVVALSLFSEGKLSFGAFFSITLLSIAGAFVTWLVTGFQKEKNKFKNKLW